ncbi:MAG: ester cyclase [Bryobacterales bacterium]|nr:ester cyclase [Bryobacterales bacterium]
MQRAHSNDAVRAIRAFYEAADARPLDVARLRSFFADDFVDHDATHDDRHAEGAVGTFSALADGAPDSHHELVMVLASGDDKAIVYWRYKGTNTNHLFGLPTAARPKAFDIAGIEIYTVRDGKITEMWHVEEIHKLVETLTG